MVSEESLLTFVKSIPQFLDVLNVNCYLQLLRKNTFYDLIKFTKMLSHESQ